MDAEARRLAAEAGATPSFLGYRAAGTPGPYPAALCVSVNDTVVHGIPDARPLAAGDLVSLDLGLKFGGLFTDMAVTVPVGVVSPAASRLIADTQAALAGALRLARPGHTLGDIGHFIAAEAKRGGYGLVTELGGHGVGHQVHEEPHVPNFGRRGRDLKLKPGLVLAIEPMFTLGSGEVVFQPDGYTVTTRDRSLAAHFEHTVVVTESESLVLTLI